MPGRRAATIPAALSADSGQCSLRVESATGAAVDSSSGGDTSRTLATNGQPVRDDGPTLIVNERDFRIVRIGSGDGIRYLLEVLDEPDALGCERWRPFNMDSKHLRQMLGFMVKLATKGQNGA